MQVTGHRSQLSCFKALPKETQNEILSYFDLQDFGQIKLVNRCFHKESTEFLKKFIDGAVFLIQPESRTISFTKKISDGEEIRYEFLLQLRHTLHNGAYSESDSSDKEDRNEHYTPIVVSKENINDVFQASSHFGCTEAIQLLLLHENININHHDDNNLSPLYSAVNFSNHAKSFSAVKLLLKHGADVDGIQGLDGNIEASPLMHAVAARNPNLESIKLLLEHGSNPNQTHFLVDKDFSFETDFCSVNLIVNPLLKAAFLEHEKVVKMLLEHGADIKQLIQRHGFDPLIFVAGHAGVSILKLLLENGSDVNSKFTTDFDGIQPYNIDSEILFDMRGKTALHEAAYTGNLEAVQFLIEHHADINAKDDKGITPFHLAIRSAVFVSLHDFVATNRIRVIQYLLSFSELKVTEFPSQFCMETLRSCIRREAERFGPDILLAIQQRLASDDQ